jgi:hypothetical protein
MAAMSEYAPRPDSVPFRAIAYLETLMPGAEIPTGTLASEAHCEVAGFTAYMQTALKHGLVFARQKGGHFRSPLFWSLVDHSIPKGLAGAARRPETAEETTHRGADTPTAAANAVGAGEDAKRDGGPASPGGFACGVDLGRSDRADAFAYMTRAFARREVPAVQLVTVSFTVPLHVAERLMQAAAQLTEVRT